MSLQFEHISAHMINDRMDRYIFIQTHTGMGNIAHEEYVPERDHIEIITDTGVLIVTDNEKRVLITCFYLSMDKAKALYKDKPIPPKVRNVIKSNMKKNYIKLQNG